HHAIMAAVVALESAEISKVVEPHHVGATMGAGGTETNRAEDRSQKSDVIIHDFTVNFPGLVELAHHVEPEDIGFALLVRTGVLPERRTHGTFALDQVLDAETVGYLVEHGVAEKRVEGDMLALLSGNDHLGNRPQDAVILGTHGVLQLQA